LSDIPPAVTLINEARANWKQREGASDRPGQVVQFPTQNPRRS
jgi:hypothetical protein